MVGSLFYVMGITVCNLHPFDFLISQLYHHACLVTFDNSHNRCCRFFIAVMVRDPFFSIYFMLFYL